MTARRHEPDNRMAGVRFTPEMKARLAAEADARGVTVQWLVTKLLHEALANLKPADEFSLTRPDHD